MTAWALLLQIVLICIWGLHQRKNTKAQCCLYSKRSLVYLKKVIHCTWLLVVINNIVLLLSESKIFGEKYKIQIPDHKT